MAPAPDPARPVAGTPPASTALTSTAFASTPLASPAGVPAQATPEVTPGERTPLSLERLQARWHELARAALGDGALDLGALLAGSRLQALDEAVATIVCPAAPSPALLALLPRYLGRLGLASHELRVVIDQPKAAAGRSLVAQAQRQVLVKELVKRFDGEISACEPMSRQDWLARLERLL